MAIQFNQLKQTSQTSNSTKPVFPRYYKVKRRLNKLRVFTTLALVFGISFWAFSYYKFLNKNPYSQFARKIDLEMVSEKNLHNPKEKSQTNFEKDERIFTKIEVLNGKNFDAKISYLRENGQILDEPISVLQISGNDTRFVNFDSLKYGTGKYSVIFSINGADFLMKDFEIK